MSGSVRALEASSNVVAIVSDLMQSVVLIEIAVVESTVGFFNLYSYLRLSLTLVLPAKHQFHNLF